MPRTRSLVTTIFTFASALFLAAAIPSTSNAQTGRIAGTVTDSARAALPGTQVTVAGTRFSVVTDPSGRFLISGIPAGTYEVRVQRLGQRAQVISGVAVTAGQETALNVSLATVPLSLGGVVVSASRRAEKITDAPATITRIDAPAIQNTVGNSFAPALKEVKGIDFIQVGVTAVAVNARGFNSAFNNRMLMMEDNRIAVLPENGLPVGAFTTIPKVDLAGIEVLVGPGSALYGPDASNGVLTLSTKDPREYQGTTLEASGGVRSFFDIQGRHAGVLSEGRLGYKITGEYQQAKDFSNVNFYAPLAGTTTPIQERSADWNTNVIRGGGALVYYMPNLGRLELNGGASQANGIGQTNVGRNQLKDWQYRNLQLKYTNPNWFAQAYTTKSLSGDTYQLNAYSQNRVRFPNLDDDSVKHLSDFPAEGNIYAAEVQGNRTFAQLNGLRVTAGAQYRHDVVSSDRQWLVDRQTGEDLKNDQRGVYGQIEIPIISQLRLVGAARYDNHDKYEEQFSPKAAVLFTPIQDQTFRVSYNRAFKSPSVLQYGFYLPDFSPGIGVFGNADGFIIKNAAGAEVRTIDPIQPEKNDTWEIGYKGILGNRLFVDVTGYRSNFKNFMSPLVIIANFLTPAAAGGPTFAYNARTNTKYVGANGTSDQIALTYFNVGDAQITGTDIGLKFLITPTIAINGTASLQQLDTVEKKAATDPVEATSFNSPTTKFNVGMDFANIYNNQVRGSFTVRYVNGYRFLSGVNNGKIPTFATFDFTAGYKLPLARTSLNLSVQNAFVCRGGTSSINGWLAAARPSIYNKKQECGFGMKHIEMINMPQVGTMAFLGIRWDR